MNNQYQPTFSNPSSLPTVVLAEASVRSVGGVSLFESGQPITSENVHQFLSRPELVDVAVQRLRQFGFEVLAVNPITINIAAPAETYERVFNTKIVPTEIPVVKHSRTSTSTFLDSTNTPMFGLIDTSNSPLHDVLEGVALNLPMYHHGPMAGTTVLERQTAMGPSPVPPRVNDFYLEVPTEVAAALRADRVHREGITGRGVKVVMTDTGFYYHPFFAKNRYHIHPVVLAPGATNPYTDEHGHGTGESANIFAVAPEVEFVMVKQGGMPNTSAFVNSATELFTAIMLGPDIISCSWGYDLFHNPPLTAGEQVLSAAVAFAAASGIIVVFSAGNGHVAFPGQHPDVISAGGVYMHQDGSLEASNYASGFRSPLFPGRMVPDVCGLVGQRPRAQYIMLPVQPGDELDRSGATPNANTTQVDGTTPTDGWARFSGTSAAAPQLAGICALIKQVNPRLTPREVRAILQQTARDITQGVNAFGFPARPGRDVATGFGLVDAEQAVHVAMRI